MTKTIVLGDQLIPSIKKPIEFISQIGVVDSKVVEVDETEWAPHHWKYIELICKDYALKLDLIFAYNDPNARGDGVLILGRWNDGVVEQYD